MTRVGSGSGVDDGSSTEQGAARYNALRAIASALSALAVVNAVFGVVGVVVGGSSRGLAYFLVAGLLVIASTLVLLAISEAIRLAIHLADDVRRLADRR